MQKLNTQAVTLCKKRNRGKKNVDAARYIRGEVGMSKVLQGPNVQNNDRRGGWELENLYCWGKLVLTITGSLEQLISSPN